MLNLSRAFVSSGWRSRGFAAASPRSAALLLLASLLMGLLAGCGPVTEGSAGADLGSRQIRALSTVGMVGDVVARVGGDRVMSESLMGPGVDPHLYRASESDVRRLSEADVVFYVGLRLEGRMSEALEQIGESRPVVAVGDALPKDRLLPSEDYEDAYDPHVWMDVGLWRLTVDRVASALAEIDPANASGYRERAAAYRTELDALDGEVRQQIARIPPRSRVLVTAHDAFRYYGRAYGLEVRGLQGISTEAEAGVGDVQELAELLAERNIRAVFVESSVPRRNIEAVQAATRSRGQEVEIGGELFSDAMGDPGTPEGAYIGMIRHNTETVANALTGAD